METVNNQTTINPNNMSVVERVKAPTPKFFRTLRTVGLTLAAIGGAILAAPVAVKNHALWAASLFAGIFKASYYKLFCHPSVHRPADEFLAA